MTASGKLTALYVFSDDVYGPGQPNGLLQATNGILRDDYRWIGRERLWCSVQLSTGRYCVISTSGKGGTAVKVPGRTSGATAVFRRNCGNLKVGETTERPRFLAEHDGSVTVTAPRAC